MAKKIDKTAFDGPKASGLNEMLSQLAKQHNNLAPEAAIFGEEALGGAVTTWIPTGSIALDTIISNKEIGGWPCGRIVELYGEEAYGKTSLCFEGMANTQQAGGIVIFYDIERAASEDLMRGYNINVSELLYSTIDTVEDIFESMEKNLQLIGQTPAFKGKPVFIVVDSLAAMKTKKLVEGTYDYNMNVQGEFAKLLGLAFKRIVPSLHTGNACLVIINQMRDKIGGFMPEKTTPGGNALKFYASVRLRLLGKKLIEVEDEVTKGKVSIGAEVTVRTDKCKLAPPKRSVDFKLIFTKGVYEQDEWLVYLTNIGLVKQGGAWYSFSDTFPIESYRGKKFQKAGFEEMLEDAELYEVIEKAIIKAFLRDTNDDKLVVEQQAAEAIKE